jgi:hypothetical protein
MSLVVVVTVSSCVSGLHYIGRDSVQGCADSHLLLVILALD